MRVMTPPYLLEQSFFQLLSDAIYFAKLSKQTAGEYESQRFARSSIINSALTVEAAANCCISNMKGAKGLINDIDKLSPLSKFDIFSKFHDSAYIDRGSHITQRIVELKDLRNLVVHPKRKKVPVEISFDDAKYQSLVGMDLHFSGSPLPTTNVDKSSMFWLPVDAETVLRAIFEFFDYYFIDLMEFEEPQVLGILGSGIFFTEKEFFFLHQKDLKQDLNYVGSLGIKQRFINLNSLKQLNVE